MTELASEHFVGINGGGLNAVAYSNAHAYGVFAVAQANTGAVFNQAIFTTVSPLPQSSSQSSVAAMKAASAVTRKGRITSPGSSMIWNTASNTTA